MKKIVCAFVAWLVIIAPAFAAERAINFTVAYKTVNFTGQARQAMTVNQQIPAPTLHFRQGDLVTINVSNKMNEETALHWHGILVPWQMDGVKGVTQRGIKHGETFKYQFKLEQSGTYWYHAHAGLQEQSGLYGAIIIDPPQQPAYHYSKDFVVVLSDWINTNPEQVLRNLKKDGDYYSPRFPLQASLAKFIHDYRKASASERAYLIDDYKMMQQMRMGLYDFSDVAYDAFLLNGMTKYNPWRAPVKVGDVVRLRFIGAGGSTVFHVKIPESSMQVVHVQGNDVQPYTIHDFTIAPGETLDVLVKITKNQPYRIYAESLDTLGAAVGALVTTPGQQIDFANISPFPEPPPVTRSMMEVMMGDKFEGKLPDTSRAAHAMKMHHDMNMDMPMDHDMHMGGGGGMQHDMAGMDASMKMDPDMPGMSDHANMNHDMPAMTKSDHAKMKHDASHPMIMHMAVEPTVVGDKISPRESSYSTSVDTSYSHVKAAVKTNDPQKPVTGVIKMELFGYMGSYIWFINGEPEYKAKPIVLQPGKRYRFVFTNTSMMHHPMHIHGHWFILRKGNGAYDPLLHTIDVPPGATITADLDTDASGQWIFHCHFLYHMMAGMTRIFQYSTLLELIKDERQPQNIIKNTAYINRPIVRVDEVRPIDKKLVHHPMPHDHDTWMASFIDIGVAPFTNLQKIDFKGLYGPDYNKLELMAKDAEIEDGSISQADLDIFYWHQLYQFWAVKGGVNYFYRPASRPHWQPGVGLEGLLPYFINIDLRGYLYSGSAKLDIDLERDTQITNNFFIGLEVRGILASKTIPSAQIGSGLNKMEYTLRPFYRLMPGLNVFAEYEIDRYYGSYLTLLRNAGNSTGANSFTVGLSLIL